MKAASTLSLMVVGLMLMSAGTTWAAERPTFKEMLKPSSNETGFTLDGFLELKIWQLAQSPLSPETMSRVSQDVHKAPHRGIQLELLAPGDFGATIHFRW